MNSNLVPKCLLLFVILSIENRLSEQLSLKITTEGPYPTSQKNELCGSTDYPEICVQLGTKVYLIVAKKKKNWHDAERFCRRQNGYLANIENSKEMDLILNYLKSKNYEGDDSSFYIGGNDLGSEGTFYAVGTGKLMPYIRWLPGEPSNGFRGENCVHLWKIGEIYAMNDERCTNLDNYICEVPY